MNRNRRHFLKRAGWSAAALGAFPWLVKTMKASQARPMPAPTLSTLKIRITMRAPLVMMSLERVEYGLTLCPSANSGGLSRSTMQKGTQQNQNSKPMKIRITTLDELLGTCSANPDIHKEFIASKSPDPSTIEDEVAALGPQEVLEKHTTVFPQENGRHFLYNYQLKGFFKDACGMLARVPGTRSNKLKAYRKVIDGLIFVHPRKIFFEKAELGSCTRPLRAQTLQGERVALVTSQAIAAGSSFECEIKLLDPQHYHLVKEWLDYGQHRGLGQWRNSGKGIFEWELLSNGDEEPTEQSQPTEDTKPKRKGKD